MLHFRNHFLYFNSKIKKRYFGSYLFARSKSDVDKSYIKEVIWNSLKYSLPVIVSTHGGHAKSVANEFMKYNWEASIKITGNSLYGFDNVKYCNSYLGKLNNDRNQNSGKNYSKI